MGSGRKNNSSAHTHTHKIYDHRISYPTKDYHDHTTMNTLKCHSHLAPMKTCEHKFRYTGFWLVPPLLYHHKLWWTNHGPVSQFDHTSITCVCVGMGGSLYVDECSRFLVMQGIKLCMDLSQYELLEVHKCKLNISWY